MNCPICGEPASVPHDEAKHREHQVPAELLLEPGWYKDDHEQIKKERRDAKEREAARPNPGRAAAAADIEAFAERSLEQVRAVAPQMTGCANRANLGTIETYRRAASIALIGMAHNHDCTKCHDTRGGPMGHKTEDCTWNPPSGLFEEHEQCRGDELQGIVEAAKLLLSLKESPRDEAYERAKPLAWDFLRLMVERYDKPFSVFDEEYRERLLALSQGLEAAQSG